MKRAGFEPPHARITQPGLSHDTTTYDLRFRQLLGQKAWRRLPAPVQRRFSKRLAGAHTVTYSGVVMAARMSRVGWLLAQGLRIIGAPLPLHHDTGVPASVVVTEDRATGGQFWTRVYGRKSGFPQVIHSSKQFAGPTGMEEHLGRHLGIALTVSVENGALYFRSNRFFLKIGRCRLYAAPWLLPLHLTIRHTDKGKGNFDFALDLRALFWAS